MAHYYHLKMIMCRERGDTKAVGSKTYSESTRKVYDFQFDTDTASAATASTEFILALAADVVDAPQHMKKVDVTAFSTQVLLGLGSSQDDSTDPTEGPWYERVGKDVFRYELGYSATSAEDATTNLTAKDLT